MSQTKKEVFADFSKAAYDLGVLKVVDVTLNASVIGTSAHNMPYYPHFALPIAFSSSNGSIAATSAQMNVHAVTAGGGVGSGRGFDGTNVYVTGVASSDVVQVLVG